MFDIGWSELVVIGVVALVVIGPKDLPRVMRTVGKWSGKVKRMGREFQNQFNEALREAELDDVKKEVEALGKIDPLAGVRKEMAAVDADVQKQTAPAAIGAGPPETLMTGAAAATPPAETAPPVPVEGAKP
jgi:sec-independent protein translocase protein TatB